MPTTSRRRYVLFVLCAVSLALATLAPAARAASPLGLEPSVGELPAAARRIMEKPQYETARWIYYVADRKSGRALLASRPDEFVFTASTAKNFTVGSVYETLGPDTRITTPVYATTPVEGGTVAGDLVLVASGDLAMGGRNALEGRFDHRFDADSVDHVYVDIAPNGDSVGQPLAGLDELARQVAASGVSRVAGDVVIDTRLWDDFESQDGPVPPIVVNDNLVDLHVTGGATEGEPPRVQMSPDSSMFTVAVEATTVGADGETTLTAEASPVEPGTIVVASTRRCSPSPAT